MSVPIGFDVQGIGDPLSVAINSCHEIRYYTEQGAAVIFRKALRLMPPDHHHEDSWTQPVWTCAIDGRYVIHAQSKERYFEDFLTAYRAASEVRKASDRALRAKIAPAQGPRSRR